MVYFRTLPRANILVWTLFAFCATTLLMIFMFFNKLSSNNTPFDYTNSENNYIRDDKFLELPAADSQSKSFRYNRDMPIAFIGGMPRSGTTLLRVILDAHPDIRCGGETRVIPRILNLRHSWFKSNFEAERLKEAGVTAEVFDNAVAEFILEIIVRHGHPAKRLCNKDPFTLKSAVYIKSMFPNAKFLFMIRDGRAVAHSIVSRKVSITGFNISNYKDILERWNEAVSMMDDQCQNLGPKVCLPIYYEKLVLHPENTIRKIIDFLELPWNDSVLYHEKFLNTHGKNEKDNKEITLSKLERSTDQVIKPVNIDSLASWVGKIPADVVENMNSIAPMLEVLGYDPNANPPNYGKPDEFVKKKMKMLKDNKAEWLEKETKWIELRETMRQQLIKQNKDTTK